MDLAEYHRFMKDISVKSKMGFDLIVATFVQLALGVRSVKVVIDRHDRRILVTAK